MPMLRPYDRVPLYIPKCEEQKRLIEESKGRAPWKKWGTYMAERCWGAVREDYSANGDAWNYLPHDHARSAAYRWGEDGMAGWCDDNQWLCFAPAFWNGNDPILKERAFGLNGSEGNHGEDVKEYYFYIDNTPTHSYARYLYKYPQARFPYEKLVSENGARRADAGSFEYELLDAGAFDQDRYFDIFVEYAKSSPETTVIRVSAFNRGPDAATLTFLPTLWFRDIWSYPTLGPKQPIPKLSVRDANLLQAEHPLLGNRRLILAKGFSDILFTENATNAQRLYGKQNATPFTKDAFHSFVCDGKHEAVNPARTGTKAAALYSQEIAAGANYSWTLILTDEDLPADFPADAVLTARKTECDAFYETVHPPKATPEERKIQRQSLSGLLWNKQYYYFDAERWMKGDDRAVTGPTPNRQPTRNQRWHDLNADFVMSMPDSWEYPWFASWDLALQCVSMAMVDPDFAKEQLLLLTSEAFLHHNGQLPAYEWEFSDANPPVQAWAALKIYQSGRRHFGIRDRDFLERIFQKLLLNFGWWVNQKDNNENNIFEGGFLGLDNVSVFDRSEPLPGGGYIEQSDGTAWMGLFSLTMMRIAFQLALEDPVYEDLATKFFEHFMVLANAINKTDGEDEALGLWNEEDGFYYDQLRRPGGLTQPLRVRSLVWLLPMIASEILFQEDLEKLPMFKARYEWFLKNRPDLAGSILTSTGKGGRRRHLLSIVGQKRLRRILQRLLDENEFLSPYGLRSLSKIHATQPFVLHANGTERCICYEPAESLTKLKGGNSNWRGPIWFPTNCLILDTLTTFDKFIGDAIKFPFPAHDGVAMSCDQIARELGERMIHLFVPDPESGRRACYGGVEKLQSDPYWRDYILFFEYFHADNGAGLGAMHQTGWTSFVANVIDRKYRVAR